MLNFSFICRTASRPAASVEDRPLALQSCRRIRATFSRLIAVVAALSACLLTCTVEASDAANHDIYNVIRSLDHRLASTMYRLAHANAHLCSATMPITGAVLHARPQYSKAVAEMIDAEGGFPAPLAVELVLPETPAQTAGLLAGDGIVAINGIAMQPDPSQELAGTTLRDRAENLLLSLPPLAPVRFSVMRAGQEAPIEILVRPVEACRTRWEVTFDKTTLALSDGKTIQVSSRFIQAEDDDAIAVIAAHELAHTALRHREKLEAAGAKQGMLAAYGRSGRLARAAEDEADLFSIQILRNAGYDPVMAVQFWRGPGRKYSGGILRSPTHASAKQRAEAISREISRKTPF